jgi:O-antigen ligase
LATSAILGVIIEKAFLPSDWPLRIGYSRFLIDFFNGAGVQSADELPWSFWTQARIFRRPSAYFASPLDMAAACLVFLGAAAAAYWTARERGKRRLGWLVLCIALVGVILASLTRMASISVPIVLAVAALALGRKRVAMVILGVSLLAGAAAFIVATPLLQDYVKNTLIFEDSSSAGHMEEWLRGVHAILQNPWGLGLGTSGIVGARVGENIGGENQYLIYGVQLGVVGLVLYTAVIAAANVAVVRALHRVRDPLHGLALGAVLAITLLGVTSEIGIYIFVAYVGWWLIGRAVSEQFRTGSTPLARLPS